MNVPGEPISPTMSVQDINRQFPACRPVFEKYGIAGCGGADGPLEPLFIFAAAHRVPLRDMVDELNRAVRGEWQEESRKASAVSAVEEEQAERLYKWFVAAALVVVLTLGMTLGVINMTRIAWAQSYYAISGMLKQIHGHAQIFGWVGLFIMGMALHAVPRFKMMSLRPVSAARGCLALMFVGVVLRLVSQPLANGAIGAALVAISGVLEFSGIAIFVWLIVRIVARSEQPREYHEKFIWASLVWLVVLGVSNIVMVGQMAAHRSVGVPALADTLWVHVALFGFAANMIFGFSLRVLPHFLGLREGKPWVANTAFVLWNAAILFRYPLEALAWIASTLELVGAVLLVWSLGIFAKRRMKIEIKGVDPAFVWFFYLAFGWLLVAVIQPFHADIYRLTPSARHAMTIGFITSMILGVGQRVLPVFTGVSLHSNRAMRAGFWLLAAGSTIVLAMAFSARFPSPWTFAWAGVTGYLVLAAVAVFAWNIAMTLRARRELFTRDSTVTPGTGVTELLELWPDLRPVLIHGGLAGLAGMRHNPPRFVTIEFASRRHGIDPQSLVALLNAEIERKKSK